MIDKTVDVILIAGMPGAGKSTFMDRNLDWIDVFFDDFKNGALFDDSHFLFSKDYPKLGALLLEGKQVALADVDFCDRGSLKQAEEVLNEFAERHDFDINFQFIFFKDHPKKCKKNIRERSNNSLQNELEKVDHYTGYEIPAQAEVLEIRTDDQQKAR